MRVKQINSFAGGGGGGGGELMRGFHGLIILLYFTVCTGKYRGKYLSQTVSHFNPEDLSQCEGMNTR
jgi:hypothetical protein